MGSKKSNAKKINGLSYREVQSFNSSNRAQLKKEDQKWLKDNGYRNVGWDSVISLYHKIEEFLNKYEPDGSTLEDLFLEADRIGNKYQTNQEIKEYQQKLAKEIEEISLEIDKHFPDTEIEIIDFSGKTKKKRKETTNRIKL